MPSCHQARTYSSRLWDQSGHSRTGQVSVLTFSTFLLKPWLNSLKKQEYGQMHLWKIPFSPFHSIMKMILYVLIFVCNSLCDTISHFKIDCKAPSHDFPPSSQNDSHQGMQSLWMYLYAHPMPFVTSNLRTVVYELPITHHNNLAGRKNGITDWTCLGFMWQSFYSLWPTFKPILFHGNDSDCGLRVHVLGPGNSWRFCILLIQVLLQLIIW